MRDEGDRFVAWRLDDTSVMPGADLEEERMERALLAYAHRSAARVGAEWFAAEFARRDEEERVQLERGMSEQGPVDEPAPVAAPEITLVDASVEDAVIGGAPTGLGLAPMPELEIVEPETVGPEPADQAVPIAIESPLPAPDLVPEPALQPAAFVVEPVSQPPDLEVEPTPEPAIRHPHVPRPPAPQPATETKRRRRHRRQVVAPTPSFVISAPEWARMSPGARRLYGLDAAPPAAATG